jgi:hypothetical protein
MNKKHIFLFVGFLFCITGLYALGNREKETVSSRTPDNNVKIVQVTGIVRMVGSSPMNELVISGSETQWYIKREERNKLNHLQHNTVTVEGEETERELIFASGLPAGIRRELSNIRIISVE